MYKWHHGKIYQIIAHSYYHSILYLCTKKKKKKKRSLLSLKISTKAMCLKPLRNDTLVDFFFFFNFFLYKVQITISEQETL